MNLETQIAIQKLVAKQLMSSADLFKVVQLLADLSGKVENPDVAAEILDYAQRILNHTSTIKDATNEVAEVVKAA